MPLQPSKPVPVVETVPFSFSELYTGLEQKFIASGYDTAQGSNVSQLITAMAYFTSMLNVNTAVNINETLLPLATQRDNVVTDARALGYEIQHKRSYTYTLELTLSGSNGGNYTIPRYAQFSAGGNTYYYMGKQIDLVNRPDGSTVSVLVTEGTLLLNQDYPTTLQIITTNVLNDSNVVVPQYYVDIPFVDVEDNGIECTVSYFDTSGKAISNEPWTKSTGFIIDEALQTSNVFFRADDIKSRTPRIYFSMGVVGTGVPQGSSVQLNVLQTKGALGAAAPVGTVIPGSTFKGTVPNTTITAAVLTTQGSDEELLSSIKTNAAKFFNTANRAVTALDYIAICNRQAPVKDSYVWGGDDELPKAPGHVWTSFQPTLSVRAHTPNANNTEFILNGNIYDTWDYALTPGTTSYDAQINAAAAYYSTRYVEDAEIRTPLASIGNTQQLGIWNVLETLNIPTLILHNRHPIFIQFDYVLELLNYDIMTANSVTNKTSFDIIDAFFTGVNDIFRAEQFNVKYFHSSLERRVDAYLTDRAGYNNNMTAKILLTQKNVSEETQDPRFRDVFIPLSVPFETYFDANGFLLYNTLPNIDTPNFIDYRDSTGTVTPGHQQTSNIYVDWTDVQANIDAGVRQSGDRVILAPVRTDCTETLPAAFGGEVYSTFTEVPIFPDDTSTVDMGSAANFLGVPVFDKMTITKTNSSGISVVLVHGVDWYYDVPAPFVIHYVQPLAPGDVIRIDRAAMCGHYALFNGFKKYITVQLYVDATNWDYLLGTASEFASPKSYLITTDALYDYTIDRFYMTSNGYALVSGAQQNTVTGPIIKAMSPSTYVGSPIKMSLFRRDRKLNLNYKSPNFELSRNLLAELNSVRFI